ncbi:DNA cytosine methyltransferase [Clostridium hydrogenum]|uniref:DNA cytosine methyltransferase n=1 Tax=Clostridium hydrogenum TaxID=2855764 RepID=UPI001F167B42|nr:DNA cytosine methyltransferase [Clostridium hydrogenum]
MSSKEGGFLSKTFLDFFAGIGGFRRGMEMAGHKCLGHCELDKYANKSYKAIHEPKEDEWFGEDIRRVRADELPKSDVWCFGFPCQDISVAGKQLGFNGNRSSLFFTVTRLIRDTEEENRPSTLFIENVKNLLSVNGGVDFLKLLIELDEIGYDAEWQVLNSKYYGVPQNRERVFIIGHLRGRSRREVFPVGKNAEAPDIEIVGATDIKALTINKNKRAIVLGTNGVCSCLSATDYKTPKQIIINDNKLNQIGYIDKNCQGNRVYDTKGISVSLVGNAGGLGAKTGLYRVGIRQKKVLVRENTKKGYVEAYEGDGIRLDHIGGTTGRDRVQPQISNTLTTGSHAGVIEKGFRIRKLTPKECFRLQGWNDEDFERAASVCSDSQLYKQAGNGVTVNVIYEIAKQLD